LGWFVRREADAVALPIITFLLPLDPSDVSSLFRIEIPLTFDGRRVGLELLQATP
jgi:hypothetical protein